MSLAKNALDQSDFLNQLYLKRNWVSQCGLGVHIKWWKVKDELKFFNLVGSKVVPGNKIAKFSKQYLEKDRVNKPDMSSIEIQGR